jgi:hypothetical protein
MVASKGRAHKAASRSPRRGKPRSAQRRKPAAVGEVHQLSATAVAAELLRTGVLPSSVRRREAIPREDERMRAGDPDDDGLATEYVGEDIPGGSSPTPDQNEVDEIGRAYGLQDEDNGTLRTSSEVLARRDRRRFELRAPNRSRT